MVQGGNYFNVGDALSSLDGAISGLDSRVTELESFPGNGNNGSGNTGSGGRSTGGSTSETAVAGTGGTDVGEGGVVTGGNSIALGDGRSEEHTSELQSLMRNSYAVFCLKKKTNDTKSKPTSHN